MSTAPTDADRATLDVTMRQAPRDANGHAVRSRPAWAEEQARDGSIWSLNRVSPVVGPARVVDGTALHDVTFLAQHDGEVLLHLNSFVDRHCTELGPAIFERVPGTDVQHLTIALPTELVASYRLVCAERIDRDAGATREGWFAVHRAGVEDPRNPEALPHPHGERSSIVRLPGSPQHPAWKAARLALPHAPYAESALDAPAPATIRLLAPARPQRLLVLFDGLWHEAGIAEALAHRQCMRDDGVAVAIVDAGSPIDRGELLPYPERTAAIVRDHVLPGARAVLGLPLGPEQVVAAGVSFGGLAAAGLAVTAPDLVGSAVVLSGSFQHSAERGWAGETDDVGDLTAWLDGRAIRTRMVLKVGAEEDMLARQGSWFVDAARAAGATIDTELWAGGHDVAWWREALLFGLDELLGQEQAAR